MSKHVWKYTSYCQLSRTTRRALNLTGLPFASLLRFTMKPVSRIFVPDDGFHWHSKYRYRGAIGSLCWLYECIVLVVLHRGSCSVDKYPRQVTLLEVFPTSDHFSIFPLSHTCPWYVRHSASTVKLCHRLPLGWLWTPQTIFPTPLFASLRPIWHIIDTDQTLITPSVVRSVGCHQLSERPHCAHLDTVRPSESNTATLRRIRIFFSILFISFLSISNSATPNVFWVSARYQPRNQFALSSSFSVKFRVVRNDGSSEVVITSGNTVGVVWTRCCWHRL